MSLAINIFQYSVLYAIFNVMGAAIIKNKLLVKKITTVITTIQNMVDRTWVLDSRLSRHESKVTVGLQSVNHKIQSLTPLAFLSFPSRVVIPCDILHNVTDT